MGLPMPKTVLDFSSNTNVLPWQGWDEDLTLELRRCLAFYPDDDAMALRLEIAERESRAVENCSVDNILVVNGSNEAVYLIASFLGGKKAALWQPVYGEYLRALSAYGADVRNVFAADALTGEEEAFFCATPAILPEDMSRKTLSKDSLNATVIRCSSSTRRISIF
jgi:histidinol-phosphate/aromatic aminotransferase/cobyric acid decarboxylase-like protein